MIPAGKFYSIEISVARVLTKGLLFHSTGGQYLPQAGYCFNCPAGTSTTVLPGYGGHQTCGSARNPPNLRSCFPLTDYHQNVPCWNFCQCKWPGRLYSMSHEYILWNRGNELYYLPCGIHNMRFNGRQYSECGMVRGQFHTPHQYLLNSL